MRGIYKVCYFILIGCIVFYSCRLDESDPESINHIIHLDLVIAAFNEQGSSIYLNQINLDSLTQVCTSSGNKEEHQYLSNLAVLLNNNLSLKDRKNHFIEQIHAKNFHEFSPYLKFSIHYNLSLLFGKQGYHLLELEEIMLAASCLEEERKKYHYEIAFAYQKIGFICFNNIGDSEKSTIAYEKALTIYEQNGNSIMMYRMTYNLSLQFFENENYYQAKEYAKRTLDIIENQIGSPPKYLWTSVYPVYLRSLAQMDLPDDIKIIYDKTKRAFETGNITLEEYNEFSFSILEALALVSLNEEFEFEFNRLGDVFFASCEDMYSLSHIYRGKAMFEKMHNDLHEYQTHLKRLENLNCGTKIAYYQKEYSSTLDRLIEIAKQANKIEDLNKWYEKKQELTEVEENKKTAYLKQLDFWYEQDLRYAKKEIIHHQKEVSFLRIQRLTSGVFTVLLLVLLVKIAKLLKSVKSKKAALNKSNLDLKINNEELNKSYLIQEEQFVKLEQNYKIIEDKNNELIGELKTQLLLASNNSKIFTKMKNEVTNNHDDNSLRNNIMGIVRESQNESIWKEIDQKFLLLNESLFKTFSERFPKLTKNDLKLCALVKMNLSNKEIARIQYQSLGSVKVAKSRLKKKLGIYNNDVSLISGINSVLIN